MLGYHYESVYPMKLIPSLMIVLAAVIRLGYFNVMEEERQRTTTENRKEYEGLPVTSVSAVLPLLYVGRHNIPHDIFPYVFQGFLMLISILFVARIRVNKPTNKGLLIMFALAIVIFFSYLKMEHII